MPASGATPRQCGQCDCPMTRLLLSDGQICWTCPDNDCCAMEPITIPQVAQFSSFVLNLGLDCGLAVSVAGSVSAHGRRRAEDGHSECGCQENGAGNAETPKPRPQRGHCHERSTAALTSCIDYLTGLNYLIWNSRKEQNKLVWSVEIRGHLKYRNIKQPW